MRDRRSSLASTQGGPTMRRVCLLVRPSTDVQFGPGSVQVHAAEAPGSKFDGWEKCDSVSGKTCTISLSTTDREVVARFSRVAVAVQVEVLGSSTVAPGGTTTLRAVVTGVANTAVRWSASAGTITPTTVDGIASNATYTAPSTTPSPNTVTVTATSVADGTKSASVTITIAASSLLGTWVGDYSYSFVGSSGCTFAAGGTMTLKITGGSATSATGSATISAIQIREIQIPGCAHLRYVSGTNQNFSAIVTGGQLSGTFNFATPNDGTLSFPFAANVSGGSMDGTLHRATATVGKFNLNR